MPCDEIPVRVGHLTLPGGGAHLHAAPFHAQDCVVDQGILYHLESRGVWARLPIETGLQSLEAPFCSWVACEVKVAHD